MSQLVDSEIENIKNTFLPRCSNEYFSIDGLIVLLQRGFCDMDSLPEEIRKNVEIVLDQRTKN